MIVPERIGWHRLDHLSKVGRLPVTQMMLPLHPRVRAVGVNGISQREMQVWLLRLQGRKMVGSLGRIMKGRGVSMEVRRDLRNTVIVPTLTYALIDSTRYLSFQLTSLFQLRR